MWDIENEEDRIKFMDLIQPFDDRNHRMIGRVGDCWGEFILPCTTKIPRKDMYKFVLEYGAEWSKNLHSFQQREIESMEEKHRNRVDRKNIEKHNKVVCGKSTTYDTWCDKILEEITT